MFHCCQCVDKNWFSAGLSRIISLGLESPARMEDMSMGNSVYVLPLFDREIDCNESNCFSCHPPSFYHPPLPDMKANCNARKCFKNVGYQCDRSDPIAKSVSPTILLGVEDDLVWEGIRITCCDGWYMISVFVYDVDNLQSCLLKRGFHRSSDLDSFCARSVTTSLISRSQRSYHFLFGEWQW